MKYKFVKVEWFDAESTDPWVSLSDIDDTLPLIITVGLLLKQTKTFIQIALNHDTTNHNVSCVMKIPIGMVKSVTQLAYQ